MGLLCCADGLCFVHTRNAPAAAATVVVVVDVVAVHKPGNLARAPRTHRPNVVCIHVYVSLPCALWLAGMARARIRWRRWLCLLAGLAWLGWLGGYADCAAATECENVYVLRGGYAAVHCRSRAGLYVVHARSSRVHRVYMRV